MTSRSSSRCWKPFPRRRQAGPAPAPARVCAGDRGYDSAAARRWLRTHHIQPLLAGRYTAHGSGLGKTRWVIERTLAWLHQFRRLRLRWERRADIHYAFFLLGCILITWNFIQQRF